MARGLSFCCERNRYDGPAPRPVPTDCNGQPLLFSELTTRPVAVDFTAGHVSSDGGGVLLARLDRSYGYLQRFATCFTDHRDADRLEHSLLSLLRQRTYGLALGYEDLNDHDTLCSAPLLASLCGKADPSGQDRVRRQDRGKALGGKSTLHRLELTPADAKAEARYKKIVAAPDQIEAYFIDEYVRHLPKDTPPASRSIWTPPTIPSMASRRGAFSTDPTAATVTCRSTFSTATGPS